MARKAVPASAGYYSVTVEIPGSQQWVDDLHGAFDAWTLKLATEGPSESVAVLPSFEILDETEDEHARFRLKWVNYTGQSAWLAAKDAMEEIVGVVCPDLLKSVALRITVEAESVIGRDVEIDVEPES
jgi:hypothetical protein